MEFWKSEIGDVFACIATTSSSMAKPEAAVRFGVSERSSTQLERTSHCSSRLYYDREKGSRRNFENWEVSDSGGATGGAMIKWRLPFDSAHQIGPETPFHGILMVVVSC